LLKHRAVAGLGPAKQTVGEIRLKLYTIILYNLKEKRQYGHLITGREIVMATPRVLEVFRWQQIQGNETVGLFITGDSDSDHADFSIKPQLNSNEPPGAVTVKAQLTDGETQRHTDGSIGRTIFVHNTSVGPQPFISVRVIELRVFP
jgi:hypothetical protein